MSLKFAVAGLLALAPTDVALAGEERVASTNGTDAMINAADSGAAGKRARASRPALHAVMRKRASSRGRSADARGIFTRAWCPRPGRVSSPGADSAGDKDRPDYLLLIPSCHPKSRIGSSDSCGGHDGHQYGEGSRREYRSH
jgi:hypothetical protein